MASRRTWRIAGVGLVLVAGGVAAWVSATAGPVRPLHFWLRAGEDPPRFYDAPGGAEITGWDITFDPEEAEPTISGNAMPTAIDRFADALGLGALPEDAFDAELLRRPGTPAGWSEYVVCSAVTWQSPAVDARLAGRWRCDQQDASEEGWFFAADGSGWRVLDDAEPDDTPADFRWGCVGDVLVIGDVTSGEWRVEWAAVVASDGKRLTAASDDDDVPAWTYRRTR